MNRNKPMQFGAPKPRKDLLDGDEAFARGMQERHDWVARFLGICPACAEYMHRLDGRLVCMTCPQHEGVDAAAEAIKTVLIGG